MPTVSANVVVRGEAHTKPTDAISRVLKSQGTRVRTSESTCSTRMVAGNPLAYREEGKERKGKEEKNELMIFYGDNTGASEVFKKTDPSSLPLNLAVGNWRDGSMPSRSPGKLA